MFYARVAGPASLALMLMESVCRTLTTKFQRKLCRHPIPRTALLNLVRDIPKPQSGHQTALGVLRKGHIFIGSWLIFCLFAATSIFWREISYRFLN